MDLCQQSNVSVFKFLLCFHNNRLWKFVSYRQEASKKPHCQPHQWERTLPSKADKGARVGWRARTPPRRTSPLCLKRHSSSQSNLKDKSYVFTSFPKEWASPSSKGPPLYTKENFNTESRPSREHPIRPQVKTHTPWTHPSSSGIFCSHQNTPLSTLYLPPLSPDSAGHDLTHSTCCAPRKMMLKP